MLIIYTFIFVNFVIVSYSHKEYSKLSKHCHLGDTTVNECNTCICTANHLFRCIAKPCNMSAEVAKGQSCRPEMLYVRDSTTCICQKDGTWPHNKCETVFKSFSNEKTCDPDSYVVIDCNVCKCGSNGIIDMNHCTRNNCSTPSRRFTKSQVFGSCDIDNWYSLAPCQFCYCVSQNKLVCNTGNTYAKQLQLGLYNLSVCGKDLIKDALGLVSNKGNRLRYGDEIITHQTQKLSQTENPPLGFKQDSAIEVNRENSDKLEEEKKLNESGEYYSDSGDIAIEKSKWPAKDNDNYIRPPEQDGDNDVTSGDEIKNQPVDTDEFSSVAIEVQSGKPESSADSKSDSQHFKFEWPNLPLGAVKHRLTESFRLKDILKPYLPAVVDKVVRMTVRKSMVSIDDNTHCTPGSTTAIECNACFCLKNNKLLCTKNDCSKPQ